MKKYKTELHTHTRPVSSCSDILPEQMVEIYKENGYDSIVITNHLLTNLKGETVDDKIKWYLEDYYKCLEKGSAVGLNVILGAEIRFTENVNDYLVFGICPKELIDIYNLLPYGIDNFYKEYKNERNVIIQAHPFRNRMTPVNRESLDGIEAFNLHPNHNSRIGLAVKYADESDMIVTCGNDFHHLGQECLCGIITKKELKNSYDVANTLKSGKYKMFIGDYVIDKRR